MKFNLKAVSVFLAAVLLLSSFGIARITHFCRMSAHVSAQSCESPSGHACCKKPAGESTSDGSCCSTTIQMFQADLQSLCKAPLRVSADQIVYLQLIGSHPQLPEVATANTQSVLPEDDHPPSGQHLRIALCTFLI